MRGRDKLGMCHTIGGSIGVGFLGGKERLVVHFSDGLGGNGDAIGGQIRSSISTNGGSKYAMWRIMEAKYLMVKIW